MDTNDLRTIINKHKLFTPLIGELIKSLVINQNIKFQIVEYRTKELSSLENKVSRKKIKSLEKVTDITGIRIILYYQDDIDKVAELVKNNFKIDEENSVDKAEILESNEFGYLSVHYIFQLNEKRKDLPEWKNFSDLKAELQIRTVLQHSWAAISHELNYKRKIEIPKTLSRKLYRLAGLFELADEQFLTIRNEHIELQEEIEEMSSSNKLNIAEINSLTIKEALSKENNVFQEITKLAVSKGFLQSANSSENLIPTIIYISKLLGLKTIGDLEDIIESKKKDLEQLFFHLRDGDDSIWEGDKYWFTELALLYSLNEQELDQYWEKNNKNWSEELWSEVNEGIRKTKKK